MFAAFQQNKPSIYPTATVDLRNGRFFWEKMEPGSRPHCSFSLRTADCLAFGVGLSTASTPATNWKSSHLELRDSCAEGNRTPHISVKTVDRLKLTGTANRMRTHVWTWDCTREMPIPARIDTVDPVVCYAYGAGRRSRPGSLQRDEYQQEHEGIFFEETALLNAEEWLLRLDYSASKQSRIQVQQAERLELVKGILINLLPDVFDIRFSTQSR